MVVWFRAWDGNYIDLPHGTAMEYYWKHSKTTKIKLNYSFQFDAGSMALSANQSVAESVSVNDWPV